MKMQTVVFLTSLMLSTSAFAFGDLIDESTNQGQAQGQLQGQLQGQGQVQGLHNNQKLKSDSKSKAAAGAAAGAVSGSKANGDQSTTVRTKYEATAASAAALDLPYCGEGVSAQIDEGGVGIANTNYVCEAKMGLDMSLLLVNLELASYEANRELDPDLANEHLIKANQYMLESEEILHDVVSYVNSRRNTAGIAAASKDAAWPIGLIILLTLL